jgi:hypothetical protein
LKSKIKSLEQPNAKETAGSDWTEMRQIDKRHYQK